MTMWPVFRSDFLMYIHAISLGEMWISSGVMNLHEVSSCGCLTDVHGSLGKGRWSVLRLMDGGQVLGIMETVPMSHFQLNF